jgi:acyl dehydratase
MAEPEFSPEAHRFAAPRYFDDLALGERFYIPTELCPGRTTGVVVMRATIHNQARELVMEGEHRYLFRRRAP